ncbi:hypothetical protein C488_02725 [Natrinema pellirubrum DSM 15624]|uniref:Uncharacterized protein n=1 Tax=Natrinema pellirubrum (strain DSM 15624 / CIP 106293 / JCM 10476 / NCIMB 786 / 157) TaxID=797303 RepID=L0JI24_NATP1|nr:hypothetical protein [Natrinema pellirubrum]AGB30949.1 hypothetical protein Natpe_1037 [Natrinema pellirubrum DSM 15624]ELY80667.1 hypothetical protein C488_02725 [Natrinema pellirubrum DSM 15624]
MSSASEFAPADPVWRYGVYLFPIAPLLTLISTAALRFFVVAADREALGAGLVSFAVTVLAGWLSFLFAAVVAVALLMDALALRDRPGWNPNPWLVGALGLVHVAGAELAVAYLFSVPAIGYYVYRRRQRLHGSEGRGRAGTL